MKIRGRDFVCIALGFALYLIFTTIYSIDFESWDLRQNGFDWFVYGPSLIRNSNCVEIDVRLGPGDTVVIKDQKKMDQIKKWIEDTKVIDRMNCSPLWPSFRWGYAIIPAYSIYLLSVPDSPYAQDRTISIPLNPTTMGLSSGDFYKKIDELKALCKTE